jgi:hypothetical protein
LRPERVAELMWEMLGPEGLARLEEETDEGEGAGGSPDAAG